jgi:hypothetical protein
LNNELEFALNGNPNVPDAGSVLPQTEQTGDTLTLRYTKYRNEVSYVVKSNDDLGPTWLPDDVTQTPDPAYAPEGTEIEATTTIGAGGKAFLELDAVITVPPSP